MSAGVRPGCLRTTAAHGAEQADNFTLAPGLSWDFTRLCSEGVVGISAAPVPEPGTWALPLGGLAVVGRLAARRAGGELRR